MPERSERRATHAGSWYVSRPDELDNQMSGWLLSVPEKVEGVGSLPVPGARAIIAPHAGYSYSGPAAAWAYKSLDVSKAKRVFILGPSHHHYFSACAVSNFKTYATPLGSLVIDQEINKKLIQEGGFKTMSPEVDEAEHSIEMHLPYVYKTLQKQFVNERDFPKIVPILVGSIDAEQEAHYGKLLAPYLFDPENVFIASSDFCHWGTRFSYTYYIPSNDPQSTGLSLNRSNCRSPPTNPPIWSSIETLDKLAIQSIETGKHDAFTKCLKQTRNTVCGRHPIGILMGALESESSGTGPRGTFKFVRYEQSSKCFELSDSSVSYASAFAVIS
ncbi:MEMO1 family [Peziza echinospora]|nr:MEMO1 family [Peziza echinospora]